MRTIPTITHANELARTAVEILFSESDPFDGKVDRILLENNIAEHLIINLVTNDSDQLTELQFMECIAKSTIPEKLN